MACGNGITHSRNTSLSILVFIVFQCASTSGCEPHLCRNPANTLRLGGFKNCYFLHGGHNVLVSQVSRGDDGQRRFQLCSIILLVVGDSQFDIPNAGTSAQRKDRTRNTFCSRIAILTPIATHQERTSTAQEKRLLRPDSARISCASIISPRIKEGACAWCLVDFILMLLGLLIKKPNGRP